MNANTEVPLVFIVTNQTPEATTWRIVNDNAEWVGFWMGETYSLAAPGISSYTEHHTVVGVQPEPLVTPQEGHAVGGGMLLAAMVAVLILRPWKKSEKPSPRGCAQPEHAVS